MNIILVLLLAIVSGAVFSALGSYVGKRMFSKKNRNGL